MTRKLLMGNEAFAHAALEAGVRVVAGYPGTPSSELIETVAKLHADGAARGIHVEWSTNEKSALELLAGASYTGARCLFIRAYRARLSAVQLRPTAAGLRVRGDPRRP